MRAISTSTRMLRAFDLDAKTLVWVCPECGRHNTIRFEMLGDCSLKTVSFEMLGYCSLKTVSFEMLGYCSLKTCRCAGCETHTFLDSVLRTVEKDLLELSNVLFERRFSAFNQEEESLNGSGSGT